MPSKQQLDISISTDSAIPLYVQFLNQLRHLILSGEWPPGSKLPSENELRRQLNISRSTIRQALSHAEAEGLIKKVPGKGTFVADAPFGMNSKRLLGYITFDFLSDFQRQLLSGAESAAKIKGYRILFNHSNRDVNEENRLLDQLLEDKVDGILIWPSLAADPTRRLFQISAEGSVPVVLLDRSLPGLSHCDYVTSDNFSGAYAAVQHLIELGHQRIVFLSRPILQLQPISERLRGYEQAMRDAGLPVLRPWLVGVEDQEMGTRYALREYSMAQGEEIEQIVNYLQQKPRPTAIFAMNDLMALQVLKAAGRLGLHIPHDLSLVGFDDHDIAAYLETPLTTVAQNTYSLGRRAAEILIQRVEGYSGPSRKEILPTHLRVRESTAPPSNLVEVNS